MKNLTKKLNKKDEEIFDSIIFQNLSLKELVILKNFGKVHEGTLQLDCNCWSTLSCYTTMNIKEKLPLESTIKKVLIHLSKNQRKNLLVVGVVSGKLIKLNTSPAIAVPKPVFT